MSATLINELADKVEAVHASGAGTFSLPWRAGDSPEERAALIDTQGKVADELQRRGWTVEVGVDRSTPNVEHYVVRIAPEEDAG